MLSFSPFQQFLLNLSFGLVYYSTCLVDKARLHQKLMLFLVSISAFYNCMHFLFGEGQMGKNVI